MERLLSPEFLSMWANLETAGTLLAFVITTAVIRRMSCRDRAKSRERHDLNEPVKSRKFKDERHHGNGIRGPRH